MTIEFGVNLPAMDNVALFAQTAERLGYDYVGCPEHIMLNQPIPNSLIALAAAAGATSRIKLMSTVVLLPLYNPAMLAKQVAVLDVISHGRFHLGVGVGGEHPKEFEACGVPVNQRGSRSNEALRVMKKLWSEENVTFEGRYSKFTGVTILPHPSQRPHPPIWVGGRKEPAMRRAALYGDGWLPYLTTPDMVHASIEKSTSSGATPDVMSPRCRRVCRSPHRSIRIVEGHSTESPKRWARDISKYVERYALAGTPADCRKRIREYVRAGVSSVMLALVAPPNDAERQLREFVQEIAPEFKELSAVSSVVSRK